MAPAILRISPDSVSAAIILQGAIAAVNEVIPDMVSRGSGTTIFATGASSIHPEFTRERLFRKPGWWP
jgi:hypothetical protein